MEGMQLFGPERIGIDHSVTTSEVRRLAADPELRVIQTVAPLSESTWRMIDDELFTTRPDVQLRLFGHYNAVCDLSLTRLIPHVRNFAVDSLREATNLGALAQLEQLESLSLGIYELDNFDVLADLPATLRSLSLGQTRSKKPNLAHLARFTSLQKVFLEGHRSKIDVLADLPMLEDVTLRSVTVPDLGFLSGLGRLWSLDLKLGGTTNLRAIEGMATIKYLELWQIRGMADLGSVARLPGLQNLFLQSLANVASLPPLDDLPHLRRIVVQNMRDLTDLSALEIAPALEEFALIEGQRQQPEHLLPVLRNPKVRQVVAGFGSQRKNDRFDELRAQHDKERLSDYRTFDYW